jgi:hypothetical protein
MVKVYFIYFCRELLVASFKASSSMRLAEGESKGMVIGANCTADAILAIREGASSPVNVFSLSSSFKNEVSDAGLAKMEKSPPNREAGDRAKLRRK